MVKSGRDTAYFPFRLYLGGSLRRGRPRHRNEPLKQGPIKSACGMAGRIGEDGGKGKRAPEFLRLSRDVIAEHRG